ncbi:hypothetical protein [Streptomyces nojiriensis]|uniref:hypothetical protein n=1 Tax=Streptomyces nojiriensis TaxID=66374 RepID=UPI00365F6CE7
MVQAARDFEVSWPVANTAFTAAAETALPKDTPPVTHLGIDETRRGKARFRLVEAPDGGEIWEVVADRWHVGLVDLVGGARLLGQVEGRTTAASASVCLGVHRRPDSPVAGRGPGDRDRHVHRVQSRGARPAAARQHVVV